METKRPVIALSGGFNPARKNHIAMILDASKIGDVVIILNSDEWCTRRSWNNQLFSKYENREGVLQHIPGVIDVIPADDADDTVCRTLAKLKPDFFGNGGSRDMSNTPEVQLCKEMGIGMMWYLGDTTDEKVLQKADACLSIAIAKVYHGE
jgi:D-beta-D-heptose 7-phosphate kinase/D-beta-D-heptose 1-phosphate adenosyltransferase